MSVIIISELNFSTCLQRFSTSYIIIMYVAQPDYMFGSYDRTILLCVA